MAALLGPTAIAKAKLEKLQATWQFQRLLHRLGTSSALGMHLAAKRGPSDALGAGRFGFPQIATALFSKHVRRRFAGAAPGENLKRILHERRTEVNRENEFFLRHLEPI